MTQLAFYAIEALVLTLILWVALACYRIAARRLGIGYVLPGRWTWFVALWLVIGIAGIILGEVFGPQVLVVHYVSGVAALIGVVAWIVTLPLGRRSITHHPPPAP